MGKWFPQGGEADEFFAFPVLAAIARRPMTTSEVARVLGMRPDAIRKKIQVLEKWGYIVKRSGDNRWVMIVRLMAVTMAARSVPGVTPNEDPAILVGDVVLEPQDAPEPAQDEVQPPVPEEEPSEGSESPTGGRYRVALQLGVPESLQNLGVLRLGRIEPCVGCGRQSPVKYGDSSVCKECARVWGVVGQGSAISEGLSDVQNEVR
jgi:hypothetical protein